MQHSFPTVQTPSERPEMGFTRERRAMLKGREGLGVHLLGFSFIRDNLALFFLSLTEIRDGPGFGVQGDRGALAAGTALCGVGKSVLLRL